MWQRQKEWNREGRVRERVRRQRRKQNIPKINSCLQYCRKDELILLSHYVVMSMH